MSATISKKIFRTLAAAVSTAALAFAAACGTATTNEADNSNTGTTSSSDITQQTITPGKLTIATGDPAYEPWVMDNKPESGKGFESAIAYAVAKELGFDESDVVWTRTSFDAAIAPGAKDFDLNIQQFSVTDERKKAVDFASSYYNDTTSIVVKADSKYADADDLDDFKDATVGAMVGTLAYNDVKKNVNPNVQTFNDDVALAQALDSGQIDALAVSTVEGVYMVQSEQVKNGKVLGRIPGSEDPNGMGILLPKDSTLTEATQKALDTLKDDGTLKKLQDEWLAEYTTDIPELEVD